MPEIFKQESGGIQCEMPDCTAKYVWAWVQSHSLQHREWIARAVQSGWTIYAGRGRRFYCPNHEPKPGHKMRKVNS